MFGVACAHKHIINTHVHVYFIYTTLVDADHGATATAAAIYRHSGFNGRASHRTRETRRARVRSGNITHI